LTSFVVSEITRLKKYEVYSQENVRTLAGWSAERMKLGCPDTKCLLALGQMDIAKLISGSVGKIGKRYTVSLNLFDTQKARAAAKAIQELMAVWQRDGTTEKYLDRIVSFEGRNRITGLTDYQELERKYLKKDRS